MKKLLHFLLLLLLLLLSPLSAQGTVASKSWSQPGGAPPRYEALQEWELWKGEHGKRYDSMLEELERHIVWSSNRAFVEQHNINARMGMYSFEVKLNHLADLVR